LRSVVTRCCASLSEERETRTIEEAKERVTETPPEHRDEHVFPSRSDALQMGPSSIVVICSARWFA
jgi:hypothetical protein